MAIITKSCPYCKLPYVINETKGTGHYGSPIRTCRSCSKSFVDKDYVEIAVSGVRKIDKKHFSAWDIFGAAVNGIAAIVLFIAQDYGYAAFMAILSAWFIFEICHHYKEYGERQRVLKQEAIASQERLKNKEYAYKLKELGYKVPEQYL